MIKRVITILLVLAIAGVAANDIWRYATAKKALGATTYDLARWAAENGATMTRDKAGRQLVAMAAPSGVTIYQYGQTEQGVQLWTQKEVPGTLVAGLIANLLNNMPFAQATSAPLVIRDYREAGFK